MNLLDFLSGLSVGVGLAAALYAILWWVSRWRSEGATDHQRPSAPELPNREDGRADSADRPPATDEPARPGLAPTAPKTDLPARTPAVKPAPTVSAEGPAAADSLRLSQRVILHVYGQGIRPPGEVAPFGLCQAGMVEALGIPQAGLAAVLRRLEAAGILLAERDHVRGRDRRLKVYRLSTRGLELARELRSRSNGRRPAR